MPHSPDELTEDDFPDEALEMGAFASNSPQFNLGYHSVLNRVKSVFSHEEENEEEFSIAEIKVTEDGEVKTEY